MDQIASPPSTQNCKFQPGQFYLFCSKECAEWRFTPKDLPAGPNNDGATSMNTKSTSALPMCNVSTCVLNGVGKPLITLRSQYCKGKPRYKDGTTTHPYCGRTCANLAKRKGPTNKNTPVPTSPTNPSDATNSSNASSAPTCRTPGCASPAYVGPNGVLGNYCTKTHREYVSNLYFV